MNLGSTGRFIRQSLIILHLMEKVRTQQNQLGRGRGILALKDEIQYFASLSLV